MLTRATIAETRVTVWSAAPGVWWWNDGDTMAPSGPFRSSDVAYQDAQSVHGADVRIVRHSEEQKP